jgi:hypothetical protein
MQKILISSLVFMFLIFIPSMVKGQTDVCQNLKVDWKNIGQKAIKKKKAQKYWIDPKFKATERAFIKKALETAVERIQDKEVWQTVKSNYGFAYPKAKTIINSGICNNIEARRNLLFHQLYYLSSTDGINATSEFPEILIHYRNLPPKRGENGWVGYAYYNRVSIYWDDSTRRWEQSGSFSIYLNKYYLDKQGIYKDVNYWAGTIGHEMLHNLGHQHPDASSAKYQEYQINVLANAIRSFGQTFEATASGLEYPKHVCLSKSNGEQTNAELDQNK